MGKTPRCPIPTHGKRAGLQPWVTVEDAISDQTYLRDKQVTTKNGFVSNHVARSLNSTQLKRLYALKEGQAYNDLPDELRPKSGYKASYGRLWRSKPAPTLTTYLAYPSCGRFSHYEQDRVITIREALRLQSFDDNFVVTGKLIEQSAQVGNAVPPILATAFRKVIVDDLKDLFGVDAPKNNSNQTGPFF
jgi:DNA (cytosine-5)-methyltransferase 1